ncbi:MAG: hydroxymethylglutaryl-CoA lyase [Planctomycetota bacterium]
MTTDHVRITDVAPRDGLQNESKRVPTSTKSVLVEKLATSGVNEVEITSFVSPKWIPQLGDAEELCQLVAPSKPAGVVYSALVPNAKGMERLLAMNEHYPGVIDKASVFTAASETFSQKNTNASIAETLGRFKPVIALARGAGLPVRGYVSCAIACPFEGTIEPEAVVEVASSLSELGADEIDLGDTIGAASVESISALLGVYQERLGSQAMAPNRFTLHLHDTFGKAADCAIEAMSLGVRSFDASAGGLGGCPYASTSDRRAPGNLATHALLAAIERSGLTHSVDSTRLNDAVAIATEASS